MALPVIRNGLPLVNADGTPALCKEGGCCGGGGIPRNCCGCLAGEVVAAYRVSLVNQYTIGGGFGCDLNGPAGNYTCDNFIELGGPSGGLCFYYGSVVDRCQPPFGPELVMRPYFGFRFSLPGNPGCYFSAGLTTVIELPSFTDVMQLWMMSGPDRDCTQLDISQIRVEIEDQGWHIDGGTVGVVAQP